MPWPVRYFTALRPSLVSGHFTTTFCGIWASSSPSFTMPSKSVATTSRLTSPGTMPLISSTCGRNGRFSLAMSVGLVVTPSTTPSATPSLISLTFAVSRKIFMVRCPPSRSSFDVHARPGTNLLEHGGLAVHPTEHVHRAGRPDFVALAGRRRPEEDAERLPGRPVPEVAHVHRGPRRFRRDRDPDGEVDLVAPRLRLRLDRQGVPDRGRRLRRVELGRRRYRAGGDANDTRGYGRRHVRPSVVAAAEPGKKCVTRSCDNDRAPRPASRDRARWTIPRLP